MIDHPSTLVRHFARLVELLDHAPDAVDEQKAALRAAVLAAGGGPIDLVRQGGTLAVNGATVAPSSPDVDALVTRLAAHRVVRLEVAETPPPAELLTVARALAAEPASDRESDLAAVIAVTSVRLARDEAPAGSPPDGAAAPDPRSSGVKEAHQRPPSAAEIVARLLASGDAAERRACRDVLARLPGGVARLVPLLDHRDPAVVVCAVEGLGAADDPDAHAGLTRALGHASPVVRRAAAAALGRAWAVGSPESREAQRNVVRAALRGALRDDVADVRCEAASSLAAVGGPGVSDALSDALAAEGDADTQAALLAALGRLATADAVHCLVQAAAPAGRLFGRKPAALRCAAVAALGAARTPAALAALRELTNDRDREVREAVFAAALAAGGGAATGSRGAGRQGAAP